VSGEKAGAESSAASLAAKVLKAYLPGSGVEPTELPALIREVRLAFEGRTEEIAPTTPGRVAEGARDENDSVTGARRMEPSPVPAVAVSQSVHDDYLVSLEDGGRYRSLRRHLMTQYGMTPDDYRAKWGLSADYPMVAPSYSRSRSALAMKIGLGGPKNQSGRLGMRSKKKRSS
jgi:predicted transcriptional regulator